LTAALIETLRREREATGIFCDFDGTLSRIVATPDAARPVPGVPEVLGQLSRTYGLVAIISGRQAEDLAARVGAKGPRYFGLYGAEEYRDGRLIQAPEAGGWRSSVVRLAEEARELIEALGLEGCEVEPKDLALSVHFRKTGADMPPPALQDWARRAAAASGFTAGLGRRVIELKPAGVSKFDCFVRLIKRAGMVNAFLAGDDSADVEMFVHAPEAVTGTLMRVGVHSAEEPPGLAENSELLVDSPEELSELLATLF
jgi:trehalose-phosphatase